MTPELKGYDFRSNAEVYASNNTVTIRNDYLMGASSWVAPQCRWLLVEFTGSIAAAGDHVANAALGRDFAKLFANFKFRLQNQDVIQISGAALREMDFVEYGGLWQDPPDVAANVAATVSNYLIIPFECMRQVREKDTTVALSDFLDSGEFVIQFAATPPTGWGPVGADWKVRIYAMMREGRVREIPALRRIKEVNITNQELSYDIGGALRTAFLTTALTTTGYTSLAAFTELESTTLKWPPGYSTNVLRNHYRRSQVVPSTLDEALLAAPGAIPLIWPDRQRAKIGHYPDIRSLHLNLKAAPTAGLILVTDTVVDRHPDAVAKTLGYDSAMQAVAALQSHGVIVGAAGNYPAVEVPASLRRHMPARIKPGGVARQTAGAKSTSSTGAGV